MAAIGLNIKIPKESLIRLKQLQNKTIVVKFNGGREVFGDLKSWDKSMNLILSNTSEVLGVEQKSEITRNLGLIIVKGSQIQSISLRDGYNIIDNPFIGGDDEQEDEGQKQPQQNEQDNKEKQDKEQE